MNHLFENRISVHPNKLILYSHYHGDRHSSNIHKLQGSEARKRTQGFSRASASRLRTAVEALVLTAKWKTVFVLNTKTHFRYKINFITLTLPSQQVHTDREIQTKVLSPFLEAWAKRRPGLLYVWKAEVQDNGNLHYHITANAFYHYKKLQDDWNKAINKLGYVDRANVENPNSTDVHSVKNVKNLAGYMVKYLSKADRYTRVLTRYHKIFKQRLRENPDIVTILPKRYFNHIKRHLNGTLWSCSKPLTQCKFNFSFYEKGVEKDISKLLSAAFEPFFIKLEHCWLLPDSQDFMGELPAIQDKYLKEFNSLIELQHKNALFKETIDKV